MDDFKGGVIIQGLDLVDVMNLTTKKKNKFAALTLQSIEELGLEEDVFKFIRKAVLDGYNDYTRSLMRLLLGDIEVPTYHG